jgi:hypothetical protein
MLSRGTPVAAQRGEVEEHVISSTQCPVEWVIHTVRGVHKYCDLALQVGGVSNETLIYSYGFSRPMNSVHCKIQTCLLIREDTIHGKENKCQTTENLTSGHGPQNAARHKKTGRLTVGRKLNNFVWDRERERSKNEETESREAGK